MKSNGEFEIGDTVEVIATGNNNTNHKWLDDKKVIRKTGGKYIVEDVDYSDSGKYGSHKEQFTIKINGTAYGTAGVKLVSSKINIEELLNALDEKIEAMENRLNYGKQP